MLLFKYSTGTGKKLKKVESLYSADPKFYIHMPDGEEAPVFDYKAFPFEIFMDAPKISKKGKTLDHIQYYDLVCSFDIETTTILNNDEPYAFMYQWQYCIEDYVFMGKTWEEFQEFNQILHDRLGIKIWLDDKALKGTSLVCYIFNLEFEFQFMRHFIGELVSPLITDKYRPLLVPTALGVTYRCAYRLTNKNLDSFTKGFPHHKLKGDLDYSIIRTPETQMTDTELAYCYNDVKGLSEALRDRLDKDKYTIASIPLTSTGYVRKDCQISMRKNRSNRKNFEATKLTPMLYKMCRAAFRGGNVHANAKFAGRTITEVVHHKDLASSYPAWTLTRTYPIGPFEPDNELMISGAGSSSLVTAVNRRVNQYCLLVTVRLYHIKYVGSCGVPYIARSKAFLRICDKNEIVEDNGRIFSAPFVELTLTDIDLLMVLKYYDISGFEVVSAYRSHRGMLPYELRKVCFDYYKAKTELKHVTSEDGSAEYNYARSKEMLNSTYGMMVMRIDRIEYEYTNGEYETINKPLTLMLDEFYDRRSSFLPYQWGVWVTAWARYVLQMGCDICGEDLIYIDTDSVFYIGDHEKEFEQLNAALTENARKNGAIAYNQKGEAFPVGIWDSEDDITGGFRTLGAKKYLYSFDGKTIYSTISGVSKEIGKQFFSEHGFDAFTDETTIPISGKVIAHYNNDLPHYIEINGCRILTASNIALVESPYTIHIKHDYKDFIVSVRDSLYKYYK